MTAPDLISRDRAAVKAFLVQSFSDALDPLLEAAFCGVLTARQAEHRVWTVLLAVGPLMLTAVFGAMCRRATDAVLDDRGLSMLDVKMRWDADYWPTLVTTLGRVRFPWFAFVDRGEVEAPARGLFPLHAKCRSSEVCLEWETALAADHPFRKAAAALGFFTHGAVDLEDTTVQRHAVLVGRHIERQWLYRTPAAIRDILRKRATRDAETGRPIIYVSTDAHALRYYTDETWRADWKMTNGIRVWCIDGGTGELIHLGGEYMNGDCHAVAARFAALRESGHLPKAGDFGEGVVATIALVTDGLDWIGRHVAPLFPDAVHVLDPYHVVEQVSDTAAKLFPKAPKRARMLVKRARKAIGMRDRRTRTHYRKGPRRKLHGNRHVKFHGDGDALLKLLEPIADTLTTAAARKRLKTLLKYIRTNLHRLNYGDLRNRGFQIGSGAMESLHRCGSQLRMKLAGCRWTPDVAQAILQNRMLVLSGRWEEWWATPGRAALLAGGGNGA